MQTTQLPQNELTLAKNDKHLILVNYAYQDELDSPESLLQSYFMLPAWANACSKNNIQVTVFQRFKINSELLIENVRYIFVHDSLPPRPTYYHCTIRFNRLLCNYVKKIAGSSKQQVTLHINGLIFPMSTLHLTKISDDRTRFIIQHHAEYPGSKIQNLFNRYANKRISHFFFSTRSHATPWIETKALVDNKVVELMECSSILNAADKPVAKKNVKASGEPLLLWTGNLNNNKDPLTVLRGFRKFLTLYPKAQLMMLFRYDELLEQVKKTIERSDSLVKSVKLMGSVSYQTTADYYNASDIFVQGSAREGSGIAVLDALACGSIPVITKIPSFIALTENASVGALWSRGQSEEFANALSQVMNNDLVVQQESCKTLFNRRWSFDALSNKAIKYYFE